MICLLLSLIFSAGGANSFEFGVSNFPAMNDPQADQWINQIGRAHV
jgi:hypothetical protein